MTSVAENEAWLSQLTGIPLDRAPPAAADESAASQDSIARLRGIFSSLEEEIISEVVVSNRGALYPSILQLIEIADDETTAGCIDELEKALQDAAARDEAPGRTQALPDLAGLSPDMDEQIALAAQSDIDEQVALALQQSLDAAAAAAAAASAAGPRRASTPPSSWRGNVAKLAAMLSPSELRKVLERVRKTGRYRGRAGTARLIDPEDAGVAADGNDSFGTLQPDTRDYEPPVMPVPAPTAGTAAPVSAGPSAALYESRVARARSARLASRSSTARPNEGFVDLALAPEAEAV